VKSNWGKWNISNILGSRIANDARYIQGIKSRIVMAQASFNNNKALLTSKLDLNLRKKIVKCYTWITALYGAGTWALWREDQKYLEILRNVVLEKVGEHQLD
jgi:hypothetical protein